MTTMPPFSDILAEFEAKRNHKEGEYVRFLGLMAAARVPNDKISTKNDFMNHIKRHFEYAVYCKRLFNENNTFMEGGGGATYGEFDMMRCLAISKGA